MHRWIVSTVLPAIVIASAGCASTLPYIYNDTKLIVHLAHGDCHTITYVRVYTKNDEMVLYGKVEHRHGYCTKQGHVDLFIVDAYGQPERTESIPFSASSPKQHGWYGAAFRTRFKPVPAPGSRIFLAIHDSVCQMGSSYDCGHNRAQKNVPKSILFTPDSRSSPASSPGAHTNTPAVVQ